jgi:Cu/Ag efflux protein CusF
MKSLLRSSLAALALSAASLAPAVLAAAEKSADAPAIKRHPLKGVITAVVADKSALMIKHEEIPGVMRAMTMMFKVDAATLKAAKEGRALTGLMSRQGDSWVLEEVKFAAEKKS